MAEFEPAPPKRRNPLTHLRHRREVFWQITIPLAVVALVLLALAAISTQTTAEGASVWADISLIWLIIPVLVFSLIVTVVLAGAIYLTVVLIRELPPLFLKAHEFLLMVGHQVGQVGDRAVAPVLRTQGWLASLRALGRGFRWG